jgi:hypothetical protein
VIALQVRERLAAARGVRLVPVFWAEWARLRSDASRQRYLRTRLRAAGVVVDARKQLGRSADRRQPQRWREWQRDG